MAQKIESIKRLLSGFGIKLNIPSDEDTAKLQNLLIDNNP